MLRHIIIWKLKPELSEAERRDAAERIRASLEALPAVIDGLEELAVHASPLASSNGDLMLEALLRDEAALAFYRDHPAHRACIPAIREATCERLVFDFNE